MTKQEIRDSKAIVALKKMGPSVFHGAFSTLLALSTLFFAENIVFIYFFKTFVCIVIYGMLTALLLLPVLLSFFGSVV